MVDNILKGVLLGGFLVADYVYRKSKQSQLSCRPLTAKELEEVEKWELQFAKPFNFTKAIIWHTIAYVFTIAFPILGVYLYCYGAWWMFFCVLIFGFLEFLLDWPAILLPDNIRSDWKLNKNNEQKQKKQIKILLWSAVFTNAILIILNSYPFLFQCSRIIPYHYEGGVLVTLMTIFLYFMNGSVIYENVIILRNLDVLFEQNVNKFNRLHSTKDILNETEQHLVQYNYSSTISSKSIEQIQVYIDRCNSEQISSEVTKANIRILNAMTDNYKKGYSELTNDILEQQLEEKISLAKRDFVKRECRLAIEILHLLKTDSVENVIKYLKSKYSTTQ